MNLRDEVKELVSDAVVGCGGRLDAGELEQAVERILGLPQIAAALKVAEALQQLNMATDPHVVHNGGNGNFDSVASWHPGPLHVKPNRCDVSFSKDVVRGWTHGGTVVSRGDPPWLEGGSNYCENCQRFFAVGQTCLCTC